MESTSQEHLHDQFSVAAEAKIPVPEIAGQAIPRVSIAIRRLMEEVKYEETLDLSAGYNRMHNRHNR